MLKKANAYYLLIVSFTLSLIMTVQPAFSIIASLEPEADSYVEISSIEVDAHPMGPGYLYVANAKPNETVDTRYWFTGDDWAYLRFDLSALPRGTNITSAKLRLYSIFVTEPHNVGVHYSSENRWDEDGLEEFNPPPWEKEALEVVLITREAAWYEWDVTETVRGALGSRDKKVTLVLVSEDEHDYDMWVAFYSKDQEMEAVKRFAPQLTVSYEIGEVEEALPLEYAILIMGVVVVAAALTTFFLLKRRSGRST